MKRISFRTSLAAGFLIFLIFLSYSTALKGGFVWDDDANITQNFALRTLPGLWQIWASPGTTPQYYPMAFSVFWLEYHLWQGHPFGYHLVNVMLHTADALLLWFLLSRLGLSAAFFAAAIFALHPVQVESVAWASELKNVLSTFFYLLSLGMFWRFYEARAQSVGAGGRLSREYWFSFALFVLALLSKTVTCSLPAAALVLIWWKAGRIRRDDVLLLVPYFVTGLMMASLTVVMEKAYVGAQGAAWTISPLVRCLIAGRALWFYAGKLVWPHPLIFSYPHWTINPGTWGPYLYPAAALAVIALLWGMRKKIGRGPLAAVLLFAGTLIPALGFFDIYPMRFSFVADHFQYLASMALIALVAQWLYGAMARFSNRDVVRFGGFGLILVALAALTFQQGKIYKNRLSLYTDIIRKNPSSWMAYNNRGVQYFNEGLTGLAYQDYRKALALNPRYADAYSNMGLVYFRRGDDRQALQYFDKAIVADPGYPPSYANRGLIYRQEGKFARAKSDFDRALRLSPKYIQAYIRRGILFSIEGEGTLAVRDFDRAISLDPDNAPAYANRAVVYLNRGEYGRAVADCNAAIRLSRGRIPQAYLNRSKAFFGRGNYRRAMEDALQARRMGLAVPADYLRRVEAFSPGAGAVFSDPLRNF